MQQITIPLFPLEVVLFPGVPLPLHIFEPRYRAMTAECLANGSPFGVIRVQRSGLASVGCTARIARVLHQYPDGRSDILAQGVDRFEIDALLGEPEDRSACLEAIVTLIPDTDQSAPRSARQECVAMHFEAMHLLGVDEAGMQFDLDRPVACLIAASMPADLDFRQRLLVERSDAARTAMLIDYYREILPALRRSRQLRPNPGDGHIM
jgi:Lon protease-like protein